MRPVLEHFAELYRYRALVASLVWRDVKARYRGSVLGYAWTLLNPLLLLLVYQLVFTRFTRAVDMPRYLVFLFVGILPWLWLAGSIAVGAQAIVGQANLVTRVCMPPQVLPAVTVLSTMVNFLLALPLAFAVVLGSGLVPGPSVVLLPLVVLVQLAFLYGIVLALATLTVRFRDIAFLVQSLLTLWFFLTPVAYPFAQVPERYRPLVLANPATPILLAFQDLLYHGRAPDPALLLLGVGWAVLFVVLAVRLFESMRHGLAEEI
ncbi:MAG TPA: ABC transporter permease [Thermodesulfobacteriota bacterium]